MGSKNRATIELVDNEGVSLSAWTRFSWRDNFTDPLKTLEIEARPPRAQRARYRRFLGKGRLVALKLNGIRQATMLITTSRRRIGKDGTTFSVVAKTVLATPVEGSADPYLARNFDTDTPVSEAVLAALASYGFDTIQINAADNLSAMAGKALQGQQSDVITTELKHKDIQVQDAEKAYAFAARIYARLGLILTVDVNGLLLLTKPDYQQSAAYTLLSERSQGRAGDRMLTEPPVEIVDTNDGQYSEIVLIGQQADKRGQKSATAPTTGIIIEGTERPSGIPFANVELTPIPAGRNTYRSEGGAAYKPLIVFDKKARDKKRAGVMAITMHGARSQSAYQIRCAVDGMISSTGRVWTTGTIARVVIDEEEIDEDMWILERSFSGDLKGQQTQLTLIPKGALVLGEV